MKLARPQSTGCRVWRAIATLSVLTSGILFSLEVRAECENSDDDEIVVVTAESPPRDSASEEVMTDDVIEAAGARSAQELLRLMPGLDLSQHGSEGKAAQFFLRGFDAVHGSDITIGIDGMPLNEASHVHGHGYADTGFLIPEAIHRIRLRKGPFALDQGNLSTAGDVQYQIGVGAERRGTATGFGTGWPLRGRSWAYHAPEDGETGDVIAAEMVADGGPFENRDTRRAAVLAQRQWSNWRVRGALHRAHFGLPGAVPASDIESGHLDRGDTPLRHTGGDSGQIWFGAVRHSDEPHPTHRTSVDLRARHFDGRENFTGYLADSDRGDARREFQRAISASASHRLQADLTERWLAVVHLGAAVDYFRQFEDAIDVDHVAHDRLRGGRGWQTNAYVAPGVEGSPADWLFAEVGIRLETLYFDFRQDEAIGDLHRREPSLAIAPRTRITAYAGDQWSFIASYGRGYRGPEARLGAEPEPGSDTAPGAARRMTLVDAAEVGAIFQPSPHLELTAAGFGFHSGAEYIYDHVARRDVDLGATRRLGIELAAQLRAGDRLRLRTHASATHARFTDRDEPIPHVPPLEAGLMAFANLDSGLFGGVQWRAVGDRPLPFDASAGGYQLADTHVGWQRDGWTFRLQIDNLFDTEWNEGVYHYRSRFDRSQPPPALPSIHVISGHPRMIRAEVSHRW